MPGYGQSLKPTPYLLHCPVHGQIFLTREEYMKQLERVNRKWECPHIEDEKGMCGEPCRFDDENFEKLV